LSVAGLGDSEVWVFAGGYVEKVKRGVEEGVRGGDGRGGTEGAQV